MHNNIFKYSNNNHGAFHKNNLNTFHNDMFYKKSDTKITKTFLEKSRFDWDIFILFILQKLNLDIIPHIINIEYNHKISNITFDVSNLISLREVFSQKYYFNFHYIINELFSFLKTIKDKNIFVNNLHIDTIYINRFKDKQEDIAFYILDISDTSFDKNLNTNNIDTLYLSLYNEPSISYNIITYFGKEMQHQLKS